MKILKSIRRLIYWTIINSEQTNTASFTIAVVNCGQPSEPRNGYASLDDWPVYQNEVSYGCNEGYTISGSQTARCEADGEWSAPAPECLRKTSTEFHYCYFRMISACILKFPLTCTHNVIVCQLLSWRTKN